MADKSMVRMTTRTKVNAGGAEKHNNRLIDDPNINKELSHKNMKYVYPNYVSKSYKDIEKNFAVLCKEKNGYKPRAKSMPLREIVILGNENTTLDDYIKFANRIKKELEIKPIDIYLHRDEGHTNEQGKWIENYHAHIMFDCVDYDTGKTIRPKLGTTAQLQDWASQELGMKRGDSKTHTKMVNLSPKQYRQQQQIVTKLKKTIEILKNDLKEEENTRAKRWQKLINVEKEYNNIKQQQIILEENLQNLFDAMGLGEIKQVIKDLKTGIKQDYDAIRDELKQSGIATQQDYQNLKKQYELLTKQLTINVSNKQNIKENNTLTLEEKNIINEKTRQEYIASVKKNQAKMKRIIIEMLPKSGIEHIINKNIDKNINIER